MLRVRPQPRAEPLAPGAVLGLGPSARALAKRVLYLEQAQLQRLRGLAGADFLLLLGERDDLPWTEGVTYLGREPAVPELYLPCESAPNVPAPLLLRALLQRFQGEHPSLPLAVALEPEIVIPCGLAQPVSRERLAAWLAPENVP